MREIKFRGKTEKGEWKVGLLTFMFGQYAIVDPIDENSVYLIDKETVGQYAGLKDKDVTEIYEGDILKIESPKGPFMGKVVNSIGTYGVVAHGVFDGRCQVCDYFPDNWNDDYISLLDIYWENNDDDILTTAEVIGNSYDHKEFITK